jgi:flagellar basal-body rod modification protein FlgD
MSLASVASEQSSLQAAAAAAAASAAATNASAASAASGSSAAQNAANPLVALSSNFGDFLQMLMTQLQNQDPTSPMDTDEFTSELVQFSGVEQQINTNSSLTQLIQLTQGSEVMQAGSMDGKSVTVQSSQLALQNGTGTLNFSTTAAEPVAIAITNSAGQAVYSTSLTSTAGQNTWTWNGQDNNGNQLSDGAYNVAVETINAAGATAAVPFTVTGTATGVQSLTSGVQLELGALTVPFSAVQSVGN